MNSSLEKRIKKLEKQFNCLETESKNKGVKLVNFNAPAELLERFDQMVDLICGTRTQVLIRLMKDFTEICEKRNSE